MYKVLPLEASLLNRACELQAADRIMAKDLNRIDRFSIEQLEEVAQITYSMENILTYFRVFI